MTIEPRCASDERVPGRYQGSERALFRAPRIAWGTVVLLAFLSSAWLGAMACAVTGTGPLWLCAVIASAAAYAAFTGMHDASHMAVARSTTLNVIAGEICATILLVRFQAFRQVHNRHHLHTNDPQLDPDRYTGLGPRWLLPLRWATTDLNYYREYLAHRCPIPHGENLVSWLSAILLVSSLAILLFAGHGLAVVLCWLLPARLALLLAAYLADYVPHQRPYAPPRNEHPLLHTVVMRGRLSWLMLGHDLHLVHHLYPALPFYRCARVWDYRRSKLLARGAREISIQELDGLFVPNTSSRCIEQIGVQSH